MIPEPEIKPEPVDKAIKKHVLKVVDGVYQSFGAIARVEIGYAIQSVLDNDMPDPDKLELLGKYAEAYKQGKMHDD